MFSNTSYAVCISLFASQATADIIYAIDRVPNGDPTNAEVLRFDTQSWTPLSTLTFAPGGTFSPVFSAQTDLTFFNGSLWALSLPGSNIPTLTEIDVSGPQAVIVQQNNISNGTSSPVSFTSSVEGLSNDGNSLVIAFRNAITTTDDRSNSVARVSASGVITSLVELQQQLGTYVDFDGMGNCGATTYGIDRANDANTATGIQLNDTVVYRAGSFAGFPANLGFTAGRIFRPFNTVLDIAADIDALSDGTLVIVGRLDSSSENRFGLHFISPLGNMQYITFVELSPSTTQTARIVGVASDGSQNCGAPPPPPPVQNRAFDMLCYDLMDHEREFELLEIGLLDQFGESHTVIGHPVSLCNPVGLEETPPITEDHLVCYELTNSTSNRDPLRRVEITNVLETNVLVTGHEDELCLVSSKLHLD
jgi:hypothetical protein